MKLAFDLFSVIFVVEMVLLQDFYRNKNDFFLIWDFWWCCFITCVHSGVYEIIDSRWMLDSQKVELWSQLCIWLLHGQDKWRQNVFQSLYMQHILCLVSSY